MQQVTINVEEFVDLSSLKQLLESIKGISDFKIEKKEEDWFDEFPSNQSETELDERLEKSLQQSRDGLVTPYSREMLRNLAKR